MNKAFFEDLSLNLIKFHTNNNYEFRLRISSYELFDYKFKYLRIIMDTLYKT